MDFRTRVFVVGFALAGCLGAGPLAAQRIAPGVLPATSAQPLRIASVDVPTAQPVALSEPADDPEFADSVVAEDCSECVSAGWKVSAEYLNWQLQRRDLDFAIATDDSALAVGAGSVDKLEFGRDSGLRLGIARRTATGWDLGFTYTYFATSAEASAVEPVGGNLWATRSHPARNQEAITASASGSFEYNVFDLEAGYTWDSPEAQLRMFGGPRWAMTDQEFRVDYDGRDFSDAVVTHPVAMNAFGVRLGLAGEWQLGRGFSLFGCGAGSLMSGQFDTETVETNLAGAQTIVSVQDDYREALPVLEAAVGLSWRVRRWEVASGYEIIDWLNAGDRSVFPNDVHEGLYAPANADLLLEGFFARCAYSF